MIKHLPLLIGLLLIICSFFQTELITQKTFSSLGLFLLLISMQILNETDLNKKHPNKN